MKEKAIFYHAGCAICVAAERHAARILDPEKYELETVNIGGDPARAAEAKAAGVKSAPALALRGRIYHIAHDPDRERLRRAITLALSSQNVG